MAKPSYILKASAADDRPADDPRQEGAAEDGFADEPPFTVRERLQARRFDPHNPPPPPVIVLELDGTPIASEGNIGALASLPKGGKSNVASAIGAALVDGGPHLGFRGFNPDSRQIVILDTEQSAGHHRLKLETITKRLKTEALPPSVVSYQLLGESLDIEFIRQAVEISREETGKPPIAVILDGGADFVADVNQIEGTKEFVRQLHEIAQRESCFILVIIHYSENNVGKTIGHLGSTLNRKVEVLLTIKRDERDRRTLYTKYAREKEIPENKGVVFAWNEAAGMMEVIKRPAPRQTVEALVELLQEHGPMPRPQLKRVARDNCDGSEKTWERRITDAHSMKLVGTKKSGEVYLKARGIELATKIAAKNEEMEDGNEEY